MAPTPTLTIAVAQPGCVAGDVGANAHGHAEAVRRADARVVVFPELSLTGYELDAGVVAPDDGALTELRDACAATGAIALAGAPVAGEAGRVHIGMLRIGAEGVEVAYRKSHPGGDEPGRFAPGPGPVALEVDGWRVGLGICRDTGVAEHVAAVAALGVDVYAAGLVDRAQDRPVQEERALRIARACDAYVAFASCAGPTGGGYDRTAGTSSIWAPDGTPIVRAGVEPGALARAALPRRITT